MRRSQRVGLIVGSAAVVGAAFGGGVLLARSSPSRSRPTAAARAAATSTNGVVTTTTAHRPTTTAVAARSRPASHPSPAIAPPESTPAPPTTAAAAFPPGTVLPTGGLQGSIVFDPATAPEGTTMSYGATITNPADHWVFVPLDPWTGFSIYLWTPETEADYSIPVIVRGVGPSAPEFQHATPDGPKTGLLLAPHGSYRFSGRASNMVEAGYATADYVAHADIIFTPAGVADAAGTIARDAGTFTVVVPASTTTTDPSA